jgi:hypothetical protein
MRPKYTNLNLETFPEEGHFVAKPRVRKYSSIFLGRNSVRSFRVGHGHRAARSGSDERWRGSYSHDIHAGGYRGKSQEKERHFYSKHKRYLIIALLKPNSLSKSSIV